MTMGLIWPTEGRVVLNGEDITAMSVYRRARHGMGYLSQEASVFRKLTVADNLLAILETLKLTGAQRNQRAQDLLAEFGLTKVARQKAYTLSGGETRRLEIARCLITSPSLLMLDEPFSGVDPIAVADIQQIIRKLRDRGIGILLTDHNVRETLSVTDRSFIIDEGKILACGPREAIVSNPLVRKRYLGEQFKM
jgi:lipopolysaccharide export system ATP-binding protein